MPDELTTTAVEQTAEPVVQGNTGSATEGEQTNGAATTATTEVVSDPRAILRETLQAHDLDVILEADPRLNGKIGERAEKQTKKAIEAERQRIRDEINAEVAAQKRLDDERREREETLRLAREDPMTLAEKTLEKEALKTKEQADREAAEKHVKTAYDTVYTGAKQQLEALFYELPEQIQAKLAGKPYSDLDKGGLKAYMQDVINGYKEHELTAAVEKEVEKRKAVWLKEQLSETNGGEPSPDLSSGQASTGNADQQFLADYAAGRSNDHARAMRLTGRG